MLGGISGKVRTLGAFSSFGILFTVQAIAASAASATSLDLNRALKLPAMEPTRCVTPAAQYHSVNPWVLKAILKVESGFNPTAVNRNPNNTVDVGIAQMNSMHFPELRQHGISPGHLLDGCIATYVAAWHLAKQMRVHGNTWFGVASYHSSTPCYNARYASLLWNALLDMGAMAGEKIRVKSLQQCGFPSGPTTTSSKSAGSAGVSAVAFDAD